MVRFTQLYLYSVYIGYLMVISFSLSRYIYIHIYIYMHTYIPIYIYIYIYIHIIIYIYMHIIIYIYTHTYRYTHTNINTWKTNIYIYIYIWANYIDITATSLEVWLIPGFQVSEKTTYAQLCMGWMNSAYSGRIQSYLYMIYMYI